MNADLYSSAIKEQSTKVQIASGHYGGQLDIDGNCQTSCEIRALVGLYEKTGPYTREAVFVSLGRYDRIVGPNTAPRGTGSETGNIAKGFGHYLGGTGTPGWEDVNGIGNIDVEIATKIAKSTYGLPGSSGTIRRAINAGVDSVDISVPTSSGWADITAGAVNSRGAIRIVGSGASLSVNGSLNADSEPFDLNPNSARSPGLNSAIGRADEITNFLGVGKPFEQNYYGTVNFRYTPGL